MSRRRLVYLVTEDWYFTAHRLPMARAAREAGYEVHVATRTGRCRDAIEAEGFEVHPVNLHRGSISPLKYLAAVCSVRRLYRSLSPSIVHHITLQASLIGALAAWRLPTAQVNTIVGLGSVFTSHTPKSRVARPILRRLMPRLLKASRSLVTVENRDHKAALAAFDINQTRIRILPGSGVDVGHFTPLPEPAPPITVVFAGRMLEDKGVRTLVRAHEQALQRGCQINLILAGVPDTANHNAIPHAELARWSRRPGVTWLGHVADIRDVWRRAHIAVLASHGEGLPVSLLEAAACGRPLVATDVPGCREIARDGYNAILVPVDDAAKLADALQRLASDPLLRARFGAAGRDLVEAEYSSELVKREIVQIYDGLAEGRPTSGQEAHPGLVARRPPKQVR